MSCSCHVYEEKLGQASKFLGLSESPTLPDQDQGDKFEPLLPGNPAKITCKLAPQVGVDAGVLGQRGQRAGVELVGQHVHLHKHQRQKF